MGTAKMFQVSTLQALTLGYSKKVIRVRDFLRYGNTGLGTFENVDGEMIVIDGRCYRADQDGHVSEAAPETGIPFGVIAHCSWEDRISVGRVRDLGELKEKLDLYIDEAFVLNSMHMIRIDGCFDRTRGGHVFDTYDIKSASQKDIRMIEQGDS